MIFRRPKGEGAPEASADHTERGPRQRTDVGAVAIGSTVEIPSKKPNRLKPTGIDAAGSDSPTGFSITGGW